MTQNPRLEPFSLGLEEPLGTATGEIRSREGFLVGIESQVGSSRVRGLGEATPLPGWTESLDECEAAFRSGQPNGTATPAAAHGLELARLDAESRSEAVSLATFLAEQLGLSTPAGSVPVNATIGDGSPDEAAKDAEAAVEAGYSCLKLKVGARSSGVDLQRVWNVIDAVDADVRLDVNGAWDRETASAVVKLLHGVDQLDYIEQPLPADDLEGLADLRGQGVDIAVDETLRSSSVEGVLEAGAADVAVLKPMALGGPAATARLAAHLQNQGVDPVVTTTIDSAVARAAAVHVAATIPDVRPCGLATASLLADDFGPDPVPVEAGHIAVPDGPGNIGDRFDRLVWDD